MSGSATILNSILENYELTEEDVKKKVTDAHLVKISQSYCEKWWLLPSQLEIEHIVTKDIDRETKSQEEKRLTFLKRWQQEKGSDATYESLISALLNIKCRDDAEGVCKLLKGQPPSQPPLQPSRTILSENMKASENMKVSEAALDTGMLLGHAVRPKKS